MKKLPKLAIVGRPNVGKSAIFNRICKKRIAIVDEAEGVTRDRIYGFADLFGQPFEVIDTGGIDPHSTAPFNELIKQQAHIAIEEADTIVMVVDGQVGPTALDHAVANILHKTKKPVCLAVNKIDNGDKLFALHDFYSLAIPQMVAVSATQSWHIAELLEAAFATITKEGWQNESSEDSKIAIIGRPNVGKSSLLNYLLEQERCIVSPIPGTTRDAIDIPLQYDDTPYIFIDTAGIRRKKAESVVVDKFAAIRTVRSIDRADICALMLDAQEGLTTQEKHIASDIEAAGKGCLILFNKWDLLSGVRMEHCLKAIDDAVPFLKHCPKLFISAKTGRNVDKIFPQLEKIDAETKKRITTGQLNKFIESAMQRNHPPMVTGKRLRIYYMAQVSTQPPTFVLFVNNPSLMIDSYKKYLINQFRREYHFTGTPIIVYLRGKRGQKNSKDQKDGLITCEEHELRVS